MSGSEGAEGVREARRLFPPRPESVGAARRFVRDALAGHAGPDPVETAALLVSELMTNAVLHARTETEVSVRASGDDVRAAVADRAPGCALAPRRRHPYADTGRGLYMIERLASRHGVEIGARAKTVWFELGEPRPAPPSAAPPGWGPVLAPRGDHRDVKLVDVPWALCLASQQHRHALMREALLASAAGEPLGGRPDDLHTAHDTNNLISARLAAAAKDQPSDADVRTLTLALPAGAAPAVRTLRRVLGLAEEAARSEQFLTRPALPQSPALLHWLLEEIIGQLGGARPTAWTLLPREPATTPLELTPWSTDQVRASRLPAVAIDDRNLIIAVNEAAADLLGWDAGDLVGRRLTVLIPEHLRERHMAAFTSLLLTGRPRILGRPVPLPALHSDGRQIPVRLLIQSQEMDDGRTIFVARLVPRTAVPEPPAAPGDEPAGTGLEEARRPPDAPLPPPVEPATPRYGPGSYLSALDRLSLLTDVERALSGAQDLTHGLRSVGRILTRRLADWCAVDLLGEHGRVSRAVVAAREGRVPSRDVREGPLAELSETARGPLARALRGAGPLLLSGVPAPEDGESPLDARYAEAFARLGARSAVIAPLRAHRDVLGALTVSRRDATPPYEESDLAYLQDLAWGIALRIENAALYERASSIAERLQHALLPVLPEAGDVEIAARYAPSAITAQVGGDWYDAFVLPGGDVALAIGDVAGHDIAATAVMSRLSSMLRGIATVRPEPPDEVVRHLDTANRTLSEETTATCVYAVLKGSGGGPWELAHCAAGHPPPLLVLPDGRTRYLDTGGGLLLGTGLDLPRRTARTPLPARSTVLMYTDGLVERRAESLDRALERLREHAAALARAPLDVFCDELLIRLGSDGTDDIALIAVRPAPPG
ncbi:SpoIIE family protein phosphatase [Actinomadura sp. 21ATH]|uniref:SpoIIE family protein phosphatase n=1 Tax=Actinomadura sp. 21ATH TaxID=1735444 RepID=UPI0035C233D9